MQNCSYRKERPSAGIIVLYKQADALRVQRSGPDDRQLVLQPGGEIEPVLDAMEDLVLKYPTTSVLIGGDFNAKSDLWFSGMENRRGLAVEECIVRLNLHVLNRADEPNTFCTANGLANIDITIASNQITRYPYYWKVMPDQIQSDHRLIMSKIRWSDDSEQTAPAFEKFSTRKVNTERLRQMGPMVNHKLRAQKADTEEDLYQYIEALTGELQELRAGEPKAAVGVARRRHQRQEGWAFLKNKNWSKGYFQLRLKEYKRAIMRAKTASWKEFVEHDLGENPWGITYRLAAAKISPKFIIATTKDEAGQETRDMVETLTAISSRTIRYGKTARNMWGETEPKWA
ncbi:hypothetical protein JTB14_029111 [Gonioctena quinquepunctata]|nr:hypothetical protein JTB14_029111 [Gonioctena quinquepunctata]